MRNIALVVILLAVVACGGAPVVRETPQAAREPVATPITLFPERPSLDAMAPSRPSLFKQETWTELRSGTVQHCHEWACDESEEASLRDDANAVLSALGIVAQLGGVGGIAREGGVALMLGSAGSDSLLGPDRLLVKLTVCTEVGASLESHRAFVAPIEARALAMLGDTSVLGPLRADVAWRRHYADGRRQIGVRWRDADLPTLSAWLLRNGFRGSRTERGRMDLVRGPERVRYLGREVWWQGEILTP